MSNEVLMCSVVPDQPAQMRYRWPWDPAGEWRPCSSKGQYLLRQKAERLKRTVEFLPLQESDPEARPLERGERQQLHAARLAAEDELKEARARSTRLYNQTVELTADLKSLRNEAEQARAQLVAKTEELEKGYAERARLATEVGDLQQQLQKANRLIETQTESVVEVSSMKKQLDEARAVVSRLQGELDASRQKHELRVAELERDLKSAHDGQAKLRETNVELSEALAESREAPRGE